MKRRIIDVSRLPPHAFGHADPLWWTMLLLAFVEGTMLVLLAVAYYYVSQNVSPWPPTLAPRWIAWVGTLDLGLLIASVPPVHLASLAARREDLSRIRLWLVVVVVLSLGAVVCRWIVFANLPFRWDTDVYGSVVWTILGIQTAHLITGILENAFFVALLVRGPVESKHLVDVDVSTILWDFVVVGALLVWVVVYLEIFTGGTW